VTHRWKPILIICVCCLFTISSLVVVRAYAAGNREGCTIHTKHRLPERWRTRRDQPTNQKPRRQLTLGSWGGEHISLEVTGEGAIAEYDCAHGTISERIFLDRRGHFSISGTHIQEHGGPVREGQQSNSIPVVFTGRVTGKRMSLTVKRRDSGERIGFFTLVYGQEASLVKCR
jgi:hypothetical protein